MTATSNPSACRKPAHSSAMYDAPTTSVFPGGEYWLNRSSEVRHSSLSPGAVVVGWVIAERQTLTHGGEKGDGHGSRGMRGSSWWP